MRRWVSLYAQVLAAVLLISAIVTGIKWFLRPAEAPAVAQLGGAASVAGYLLVIAVGAGIAAMATVQFWKVVFRPRGAFHRQQLEREFRGSLAQVLGVGAPQGPPRSPEGPFDGRPTVDPIDELLENPTEVVMGQLRSAADYILVRPEGFESTLEMLAGSAGKEAVRRYLEPHPVMESDEALIAVRFFVEQRLNLLHVALKERWRRYVRLAAVIVAGSTGLIVISLSPLGPGPKLVAIGAALMWGGFFAWFARDLVALVERRRG
jgi:hypothetical protein